MTFNDSRSQQMATGRTNQPSTSSTTSPVARWPLWFWCAAVLLAGCISHKATGPTEITHADGTWTGYAESGEAHPPQDWNAVSWPIVILRDMEGPTTSYPNPRKGPRPRPTTIIAYPPPPLVDRRDYLIELPGVAAGARLAVTGTRFDRRWPLAPDGTRVTSVGPGWVSGQPVIRVDKVVLIQADGSRQEVNWRRVQQQTAQDRHSP